MNVNEILRRYAQVEAEIEAREHAEGRALRGLFTGGPEGAQTGMRWLSKLDAVQPRKSRVQEIEASIRCRLAALPEAERGTALEGMRTFLNELAVEEAELDQYRFAMDWSRGEKPSCPSCPWAGCPLLFKEIGYSEGQDPGARATPEELAQCPRYGPHELVLEGVAPKVDFCTWWKARKKAPARGQLLWVDGAGTKWPVAIVEGRTVAEMMRRARRMLHAWVTRRGEQGGTGEVFLLRNPLDSPTRNC